jgi:hypothetical protein
MHLRNKGALKRVLALAGFHALLSVTGCGSHLERQITAAPLSRYGQAFEVTVLTASAAHCRIRTRLPAPYSAAAWIEIRNSAVHAARQAARICCATPRVAHVADWMAGFAAWEVTFVCPATAIVVPGSRAHPGVDFDFGRKAL